MRNLFILVVLLGIFLRVDTLGRESLWNDELSTLARSMVGGPASIVDDISRNDVHPPVYFILQHFVLEVFGDSAESLRMLSAISSSLTIITMAILGTLVFSQTVGFISALFWAFSYTILIYAQEARSYSFVIFFLSIVMICAFKIIRLESTRKHFVLIAAAAVMASLSHYFAMAFAAMVIGSVWLIQLLRRRSIKPIIASTLTVVFFDVLWMIYFKFQDNIYVTGSSPIPEFSRPTAIDFLKAWIFINDNYLPLAAIIVLLLGFFAAKTIYFYRQSPLRNQEILLLYAWAICPLVGTYLFSLVATPMFIPRYLLVCLPPLVLLKSEALASIKLKALRYGAMALVGFVVIYVSLISKFSMYSDWPRNEQFREASFEAAQQWEPGTEIYSFAWSSRYIDYYLVRTDVKPHVTANLPDLTESQIDAIVADKIIVVEAGRGWTPESPIKRLLTHYRVENQKRYLAANVMILRKNH